ncbi:kinase-like domain-containing protein [Gongronella butleri]|nr:kinase-like domain-containing protein [Gongronella butleri]
MNGNGPAPAASSSTPVATISVPAYFGGPAPEEDTGETSLAAQYLSNRQPPAVDDVSSSQRPAQLDTRPTPPSSNVDTTPPDSTEQDVHPEDLEMIVRLGQGAAGTVDKVLHRPSGLIMARKQLKPTQGEWWLKKRQSKETSIPVDADPNVQRQVLRELAFMKKCQSPYVVSFYGAFLNDGEGTMSLCMEYAEGGSLLDVYQRAKERGGIIGEAVLERIAESVCKGLVYLHSQKLIHRDIKPSNILLSKSGEIKLCDFGVSGELINSVAATFTGTKYYMARIQGKNYAVQSDIWSLGLTLIEVSQNEPAFPPPDQPDLSVFELLTLIVQQPVPEIQGTHLSDACRNFVAVCLTKDPAMRPTPQRMLEHPFIKMWENCFVDIAQFAKDVWGW